MNASDLNDFYNIVARCDPEQCGEVKKLIYHSGLTLESLKC
jgi:hypothetical protein